jgi:hypothetical protein
MTVTIAIGEGRTVEPVVGADGETTVGYIERHPKPDNLANRNRGVVGDPCSGFVQFAGDGARWTREQADPLTLSPSIACRTCGNHGFIRDGKWVPA